MNSRKIQQTIGCLRSVLDEYEGEISYSDCDAMENIIAVLKQMLVDIKSRDSKPS